MKRQNISSGRPWEEVGGYSRAVRIGDLVEVGMITASAPDGTILFPGDVYLQTKECLRFAGEILAEAGGSFEDVYKTRMFMGDMKCWALAAKAHNEIFHDIKPATGWIGMGGFFTEGIVVELELTAHIGARP